MRVPSTRSQVETGGLGQRVGAVDGKPAPAVLTPGGPQLRWHRLEGGPVEEALQRAPSGKLFRCEPGDRGRVHRTGDLADTFLVHRNHRQVRADAKQRFESRSPNEAMIDGNDQDPIGVGSPEDGGNAGEGAGGLDLIRPALISRVLTTEDDHSLHEIHHGVVDPIDHGDPVHRDRRLVGAHPAALPADEDRTIRHAAEIRPDQRNYPRRVRRPNIPPPRIDPEAVIAPGAHIYGDVTIGVDSFILFGVVIRAELDRVTIGWESNVQDNAVLHCDEGIPCQVGNRVTIGHGAVVHGSTVADRALIAIGARALNNSTIGEGAWLGAGAVLAEGKEIPPWTLAVGVPARPVRELTEEEIRHADDGVDHYLELAAAYRRIFAGEDNG